MSEKTEFIPQNIVTPKIVKIISSILVGLGVGFIITPETLVLPYVDSVSSIFVGVAGIILGSSLYLKGPELIKSPDCDCSGDCGC